MNELETTVDAKDVEISNLPMSLSDQYREKMGKLLDLTEDQKNRIKKWLKEKIADWKQDTAELNQRLQDDNDLVEGIIMETDFPWVGACYDKETEVLTFNGWKNFSDLTKDDFVYSLNPSNLLCSYQPITAIQKFKAKEIIQFKGKSLDLAVTGNHNMFVWSELKDAHEFVRADHFLKIDGHEFKIPIAASGWRVKSVDKIYGFDAEDWMSLLGWYISEGYSVKPVNSHFPAITICQSKEANPEKCIELETLFKRMGIGFTCYEGKQYRLNSGDVPQEARILLDSLGICYYKRIPRHYLNHSQDLLTCLLESLIAGDGHTIEPSENSFRKNDSYNYSTSSKGLADDVQELAHKLGYNSSVKIRMPRYGGIIRGRKITNVRISYEVSIGLKKRVKVGQLKREVVPYDDFVYCATTTFHTLLVRRNGKAAWCGNSNVHEPLTEIYMDGTCSIEKRSILGAGLLWVCETDQDEMLPIATKVAEMMNYNARNRWNVERAIPGIIWNTNRDGLGIVQCPYVETYEKTNDIIIITSAEEFDKEFPNVKDSGMDQEEFYSTKELCQSATEQNPVEILISFEKQTYAGPKAEIVERVDFVTIPAWVPDIKDERCRGYGKRYAAHIETIREKSDDGVWYKEECEAVIDSGKKAEITSYVQAKDDITGIKRTNSKDERELYELIIKGRLDDGGEIEKFLVTYHHDSDKLLQVIDFIYRVDFYALFRTDDRPNQLGGKSIPAKTRDMNDLSDTLVNQTVNANTISTVPMFKQLESSQLDMSLNENKIKPGGIIKLPNFDEFAQFIIQPTDHGENIQLTERAMRVMDMYIGMPASLFAGGVPAGDPTAPGNKTNALIEQGNLRMENPISCLRHGMADLGDICLSHVYQFGPPELSYLSEEAGPDGQVVKKTQTVHKKYLRKDLKMKMNGISVIDNPDAEMQKQFNLHTVLMTYQGYAQDPSLQNEVLRDALMKGQVSGRERYLPKDEVLKQKMIDLMKQAQQKMELEQQMKEKQAQEDQVKGNLAKAKQVIDIQNTSKKLAEHSLGTNGSPVV